MIDPVNIFNFIGKNMESPERVKDRNKKFYTDEGIAAMKKRLENWKDLFNKDSFPIEAISLGFCKFRIESKEEMLIRIIELGEIIGEPITIVKNEIHTNTGTITQEAIR